MLSSSNSFRTKAKYWEDRNGITSFTQIIEHVSFSVVNVI